MSHMAHLLTTITVKEHLLAALNACKLPYSENATITNEWTGDQVWVDIRVQLHDFAYGYSYNTGSYQAVFYSSHDTTKVIHRVGVAYAESLVKAEMSRKKFLFCGMKLQSNGAKLLTFKQDTAMILATIDTKGNVTIETKGFKGKSCVDATAQLEIAVGKTAKMVKKPEFCEPPSGGVHFSSIYNKMDYCG